MLKTISSSPATTPFSNASAFSSFVLPRTKTTASITEELPAASSLLSLVSQPISSLSSNASNTTPILPPPSALLAGASSIFSEENVKNTLSPIQLPPINTALAQTVATTTTNQPNFSSPPSSPSNVPLSPSSSSSSTNSITQAPGSPLSSASPERSSSPNSDLLPMKTRKKYTRLRPRENWTKEEHQKFLEALKLYGRDWNKIRSYVRTKTKEQIRSHAQKYFLKIQRSGSEEEKSSIPPPRPKAPAKWPYPLQTSKAFSDNEIVAEPKIKWTFLNKQFPTPNSSNANSANITPTKNEKKAKTEKASKQNVVAQEKSQPKETPQLQTPPPTQPAKSQPSTQPSPQPQLLQVPQQFLPSFQPPQPLPLPSQVQPQLYSPFVFPNQQPNYTDIYAFLGILFDPTKKNQLQPFWSQLSNVDRTFLQSFVQNLATSVCGQQAFTNNYYNLLSHMQAGTSA